MSRRMAWVVGALLCLGAATGRAQQPQEQGFDWEVEERDRGPAVRWIRGARDGLLGLVDDVLDLSLGVFAELALSSGQLLMAVSDGIGLVDDNPVTEHVFKAIASKSLARTAYLLHQSGGEAIRGSHGLEAEWYVAQGLEQLNPLVEPQADEPRIPQDPLDFLREGLFHSEVYVRRIPGETLAASVLADGLVRPAGNLLRLIGVRDSADDLEQTGRGLIKRTVE
jgi:hypothetical protein